MATGLFLAQVCLAAKSTIPADVAVNSFHFWLDEDAGTGSDHSFEDIITGDRPVAPDVNGIQGDLSDLYREIQSRLSSRIEPLDSVIKWYNLSAPAPRYPILELPLTGSYTIQNTTMPSEVAVCCSFQAEKVNGLSQASRRNRVYIGPLSTAVNSLSGTIDSVVRQDFADAFENLASNSNNATEWTWVIYSPTTGEHHDVHDGWVDNAFDTQRRRGVEATERTTWEQNS